MKAAVLHAANQPLRIEELSVPAAAPNHTLLRVLACGVCRTDLHIFEGDHPSASETTHPRSPDRRRSHRWRQQRNPRRRLLDRRHRRHLPFLPSRRREPLRPPHLHRLLRQRRLRRVRPRSLRLHLPPSRHARQHPRRTAALRRDHRLPQPACRGHATRRARRPLRLRSLRRPGHSGPPPLEL